MQCFAMQEVTLFHDNAGGVGNIGHDVLCSRKLVSVVKWNGYKLSFDH